MHCSIFSMPIKPASYKPENLNRKAPLFIGSDVYRRPAFGRNHPLSISRHGAVIDIARALGWLPDGRYRESPTASEEALSAYHDPRYVKALKEADAAGAVSAEIRERYRFGTMENPLFPDLFERASTTVGGSILAAAEALKGRAVFSPGGGTHHGRKDQASRFCYFNDPVFAILKLLEGGQERVAYVDLDAHHGDGVEAAFAGDHRVRLVSIHEENRWPYTGTATDRAADNVLNLPVPSGFHDNELYYLLDNALTPFLDRHSPQAVVVTCGADALDGDPLSKMALSNAALQQAVTGLVDQIPAAVVLGGGGYNPWTTVRCWAGLWGKIAGFESPRELPVQARDILANFECDLVDEDDMRDEWLETLDDQPRDLPVRESVKEIANALLR